MIALNAAGDGDSIAVVNVWPATLANYSLTGLPRPVPKANLYFRPRKRRKSRHGPGQTFGSTRGAVSDRSKSTLRVARPPATRRILGFETTKSGSRRSQATSAFGVRPTPRTGTLLRGLSGRAAIGSSQKWMFVRVIGPAGVLRSNSPGWSSRTLQRLEGTVTRMPRMKTFALKVAGWPAAVVAAPTGTAADATATEQVPNASARWRVDSAITFL